MNVRERFLVGSILSAVVLGSANATPFDHSFVVARAAPAAAPAACTAAGTHQGVVKHDWLPTAVSTLLKLLVEERRIVESIAGNENLEIQWRLATLSEAKAVVTQYHKYLSENSLIKSIAELSALSLSSMTTQRDAATEPPLGVVASASDGSGFRFFLSRLGHFQDSKLRSLIEHTHSVQFRLADHAAAGFFYTYRRQLCCLRPCIASGVEFELSSLKCLVHETRP